MGQAASNPKLIAISDQEKALTVLRTLLLRFKLTDKNPLVCIKLKVFGIGSQDKITCDFFYLNLSRKFDGTDPHLSGRQLMQKVFDPGCSAKKQGGSRIC